MDEIRRRVDDHEKRIVGVETTWLPWNNRLVLWGRLAHWTVKAVKWLGLLLIGLGGVVAAIRSLR